VFSVAVATVLFPTLSRQASARDPDAIRRAVATGLRQINLLLIPAAAILIVLATPITRLVFQRGQFNAESTHLVSIALFWFAFSLPFAGVNLLLTRTFFAVQKPWIPTRLAVVNLIVGTTLDAVLYIPFGIGGLVLGTAVANAVQSALLLWRLRIGLEGRLEGRRTAATTSRVLVASVLMAVVALGAWAGVDWVVGRSLPGQLVSVGLALLAAGSVYAFVVLRIGIPEAQQIEELVRGRLGGRG
jgi:putative peptidoglycan lipid II flippase